MARFPLQLVSPQNRAAFQWLARFFQWLFASAKANWRGFLIRFSPLWLPLLLILALPWSREIVQRNREVAQGEDYSHIPPDPLKRALSEPQNLGAQLNAIWRTRDLQADIFTRVPDWQRQDGAPAQPRLDDWLKLIAARFPEKWMPQFVASVRLNQVQGGFFTFPASGTLAEQRIWIKQYHAPELGKLKPMLEAGGRQEPRNAFWIMALAQLEWRYAPRTFYPPTRSNFAFTPTLSAATFIAPYAGTSGGPSPPTRPMAMAASTGPDGYAMPAEPLLGPHPLPRLVPDEEAVVRRCFAILKRADRCTYFEDGNWQARREMTRDWERAENESLEGQRGGLQGSSYSLWSGDFSYLPRELRQMLWGPANSNSSASPFIPYAPSTPPEALAQRALPRQLLQWGSTLAHIGRLVDRLPHVAYSRRGRRAYRWLDVGWTLDIPRAKGRNGTYVFKVHGNATGFARKARRLGRPDIARETLAIEQDFAVRDALVKRADRRAYTLANGPISTFEMYGADALLPRFAFLSSMWCETIALTAWSLCFAWLFLNAWLVRGEGVASSRRSRWLPATTVVILLGVPVLWAVGESASGTGLMAPIFKVGPVIFLAFAGTIIVLLALWCACLTTLHHQEVLVSPEDDRWHTHFLARNFRPWVEPISLCTSAFLVLIAVCSLTYFILVPGSGTTPLPLGFVGISTTKDAMGGVGAYGLGSGAVGFLVWLLNWRFGVKTIWPITHSGLRWWKECLGASICILAWAYLFMALAA